MLLVLVSLSVLGLFVGALLPAIGRVRAEAESALSGLALGMLPALVLARLLPHTFESLGLWSLVFAAVGFGLVTLSHQAGERAEARLGSALVLPALLLHAVGDGATLAISSSGRVGSAGGLLAAAAILHRVPEGLFMASSRKRTDLRGALSAALPLALATLAGALTGQRLFELLPDSALDAVLALGAGAMLRMLSHTHEHDEPPPRAAHAFAAVGFMGGLALVLAVPGPHDVLQRAQPQELSIAASLWPLFVECAPAILLGLVAAAALHAWPGRQSHAGSLVGGLVAGVRQPVVDGGALAAAEGFLRSGLTPRYVVAWVCAGLLLGVESLGVSFRLFGSAVGWARVLGGGVLAVLLGALAGYWSARPLPAAHGHVHGARGGFFSALQGLLDQHGAPLCLGLLGAAALEAALAPEWLSALGQPWDLLLAAAAAALCPISALSATPLAAVLLHKGASVGAGLTFLWLTPLLQPTWLIWLGRCFELRVALTFVACALGAALALGVGANAVLSAHTVPQVHPLIAHDHALWEIGCALLLGALLLASLLRLGPKGFAASLRTVTPARAPHHHAHDSTQHRHAFEAP